MKTILPIVVLVIIVVAIAYLLITPKAPTPELPPEIDESDYLDDVLLDLEGLEASEQVPTIDESDYLDDVLADLEELLA